MPVEITPFRSGAVVGENLGTGLSEFRVSGVIWGSAAGCCEPGRIMFKGDQDIPAVPLSLSLPMRAQPHTGPVVKS